MVFDVEVIDMVYLGQSYVIHDDITLVIELKEAIRRLTGMNFLTIHVTLLMEDGRTLLSHKITDHSTIELHQTPTYGENIRITVTSEGYPKHMFEVHPFDFVSSLEKIIDNMIGMSVFRQSLFAYNVKMRGENFIRAYACETEPSVRLLELPHDPHTQFRVRIIDYWEWDALTDPWVWVDPNDNINLLVMMMRRKGITRNFYLMHDFKRLDKYATLRGSGVMEDCVMMLRYEDD